MLYLEDFLELIESFPHELKERLLEIRELDSHVQTETEKLDVRADGFFTQCKKQKIDWKTENFENIKKEYNKLLETVDDKVQIANQLNDLIEKYLKKLDQEIHKFKLELEADHAGITSKLEKTVSTQNQNFEVYNEDVFNSLIDDKSQLYDQFDTYTNIYSPVNLNDSNTFQFNPHSYNQQSSVNLKSQLLRTVHHRSRNNKKLKMVDELDDEEYYDDETNEGSQFATDEIDSSSDGESTVTTDKQFKEDMNDDPNEEQQRYCICKDVSYGDMILCDNRRCVTQWFHFTCVGLNAAPKGKWYCPMCVSAKKKRKEKQQLQQSLNGSGGGGGGQFSTASLQNHSTNSNDGMKLNSSDIYNDDFDFKFQMPKIFTTNKKQQQQHSSQNDNLE